MADESKMSDGRKAREVRKSSLGNAAPADYRSPFQLFHTVRLDLGRQVFEVHVDRLSQTPYCHFDSMLLGRT